MRARAQPGTAKMRFSKMPVGTHVDQNGKEISDVCDMREMAV
jgi:hypothetical protein